MFAIGTAALLPDRSLGSYKEHRTAREDTSTSSPCVGGRDRTIRDARSASDRADYGHNVFYLGLRRERLDLRHERCKRGLVERSNICGAVTSEIVDQLGEEADLGWL